MTLISLKREQGVTIVDLNESNGQTAVKELTEEFGPNRVIFVKTDVTKQDQFEGIYYNNNNL